ncbi:carboxypeptidase-like regulatory domain-containing protein [Planctomycetota bacterium]|nr:carboxypeptidase-like regulatory domain-containing protein [Planctomycetota bacterium]
MSQTRILFALLASLLLVTGMAWAFFAIDEIPTPTKLSTKYSNEESIANNDDAISTATYDSNNPARSNKTTTKVNIKQPRIVVPEPTSDTGDDSTKTDGRSTPPLPSGQTTTTPKPSTPKPVTKRKPKRLTHAQREEARRIKTGRPALKRRLSTTPRSSLSSTKVKTPEQQEWDDSFIEQGIEPPEMIPTKVTGKIMSEQSREGLKEAIVGLMTFFPLDGLAGGALYPVLTTLKTDDNGHFSGEIPGSKLLPSNYAALAMTVTWEGYGVLAGEPVAAFEAGVENSLGIIWAPEKPYQIRCDASAFSGSRAVVATGQLDPQRWHPQTITKAFSWFPQFTPLVIEADAGPIPASQPQEGQCDVLGTWDTKRLPYVTLFHEAQNVQARRPTRAKTMSNVGGQQVPTPFEILVFDNTDKQPISGQVIDSDGAAIANAEVTALGDAVTQTVITDATGWFRFADAPEKTTHLHVTHTDWVEIQQAVEIGDIAVQLVLETPRPRFTIRVTDLQTQLPITEVNLRVTGIHPFGPNKGKPRAEEFITLTDLSGEYAFEWKHEIKSIVLEKIGYFPYTLNQPAKQAEQESGIISVALNTGRELTFRPRDFTNAERTDRWFPDSTATESGIRTNWSRHWIEYNVDFGDAPEEGQEGGHFDVILGCTNAGIVDNDYEFEIEIYVDNKLAGKLVILADSTTIRTGRLALGELSGEHNIRLRWLNDKWIPNQLDANVRYASLVFVEQPG